MVSLKRPELLDKLPSAYLICKQARSPNVELQKMLASLTKGEVGDYDSGYVVMPGRPDIFVDLVQEAVRCARQGNFASLLRQDWIHGT